MVHLPFLLIVFVVCMVNLLNPRHFVLITVEALDDFILFQKAFTLFFA